MAYYRLHVSEYVDFHELIINTVVEDVTEYDFTGLDYGTKYYWRIKSVNNLTGKESDWSSVCWFITRPPDIIIQQTSAVNDIIFEAGSNSLTPECIIETGQLGTLICLSGTYEGQLGTFLCKEKCLIDRNVNE